VVERRPPVRDTMVRRTCIDCGATELDVRIDRDGLPRCFDIRCTYKAALARRGS
jgi:hypothetical protein